MSNLRLPVEAERFTSWWVVKDGMDSFGSEDLADAFQKLAKMQEWRLKNVFLDMPSHDEFCNVGTSVRFGGRGCSCRHRITWSPR